MPRMKDVDDLKDSLASVGGAMGTWPYRSAWYVCRWERTGQTDPNVVAALMDSNTEALAELGSHARVDFGLDTSTLDTRRRALEDASAHQLREALARAYRQEYGPAQPCPYEEEGSDKACHRCPVAADAVDMLVRGEIAEEPAEAADGAAADGGGER